MDATTRAVIELGDHLVCQGIEKVTVESTEVIWGSKAYKLDIAQVALSETRPRREGQKRHRGQAALDGLRCRLSAWQTLRG